MARLPLADANGYTDPAYRLIANAPNVFGGWVAMVDELSASPTFDVRTRELIISRVAELQDCRYPLGRHPLPAELTDTERAALGVVDELCTTHRLTDESFAAARSVFGDEALTELLMIVGCYYGLALVLNAAELEVGAP
ncbi:carboxymuconolactone decarboxylase family protein [Mycobacterium parmense]|uniref:Uncharacterized protein n=1 Tax=Mycobacterium parmense TaxID=185642 RepID=A0A7I7YQQ5_9MYCO|nr:hypothetical protein [Mycobacterium parmense]MCV7349853.1 carboxymuconolactone decarboxylase family protein [Mycobacterium parmense]ORW51018.1 hypothetical protein AWC20_23375 [Mycobacterium parmense]BBZ43492.1 hypothetical protein MPRM_07730 [Mycobacterium parmense]